MNFVPPFLLAMDLLRWITLYNPDLMDRVVETHDGPVRGRLNVSLWNQKPYYSFRGIPFAKPPLGQLRFKPPEPIDYRRTKILDAFEYGEPCPQIRGFAVSHFSEDCLFLNIFVPGAYREDSGDDHHCGPQFLMETDIILVTFNHRLGMLGFMSLGTPEYSGNMALKDQQLALKWTFDNIEFFGGDNQRITLAGHSSGAVLVSHQLVNRKSSEYFQQVLIMSGGVNEHINYITGDHRCLMDIFAKRHMNSTDNDDDLIEFLQQVPLSVILEFEEFLERTYPILFELEWVPVIEKEDAIHPITTELPLDILLKSSINKTASYVFVNRESLITTYNGYADPANIQALLDDFSIDIPINGYGSSLSRKPYLRGLMNTTRDFFFANATTDFQRADARLILDSAFQFTYSIDTWVKAHASVSLKDLYYMRFSVDTFINMFKRIPFPGAAHGDELCYIFWCHRLNGSYQHILRNRNNDRNSSIAFNGINVMNQLISNFVKFGTPAVKNVPVKGFEPIRPDHINFLDVTNNGLFVGESPSDITTNFIEYFVNEARRLVEAHGDAPHSSIVQQRCDEIDQMNGWTVE